MNILILGGSGSGKSERAEEAAVSLSGGENLWYLATMRRDGDEADARIGRHRALRQGKGFVTIEKPVLAGEIAERQDVRSGTVLLECLSNWVANELFPLPADGLEDPFGQPEGAVDYLYRRLEGGISELMAACKNLVIVSNDIFSEGLLHGDGKDDIYIQSYLRVLGLLNQYIAKKADKVYEVAVGIAIARKGEAWPFSVHS